MNNVQGWYALKMEILVSPKVDVSLGAGGTACRTEETAPVSCQQRRGDPLSTGLSRQFEVVHIRSIHNCMKSCK